MNPLTLRSIWIWMLVIAQAIPAISAPIGLLVCREDDGTSHLKWSIAASEAAARGVACCTDLDSSGPALVHSASDMVVSGCDAALCLDRPFEGEHAAIMLRAHESNGDAPAWLPPTACAIWSEASLTQGRALPASWPADAPECPVVTMRSLRATILII